MGSLSKFLLIAFEITNELYTALGAGVLGMVVLLKHGFQNHQCVKTLSVVAFTAGCWVYINREHESLKPSKKKVVCITGCDSGLGFSLAQHAVQMGFTVIAGFLSLDSKGCKEIKQLFGSNIIQIQLDITDSSSVQASVQTLEHFLGRNPGYSDRPAVDNAPSTSKNKKAAWTNEVHIFNVEQECNKKKPPEEVYSRVSPLDFFYLFFDEEVLSNIQKQTNLYGQQKNVDLRVTTSELLVIFGGMLLSGYGKYPNKLMYLSSKNDVSKILSESMSLNRFELILRYLHLNDNSQIETDNNLYKSQPLIDKLSQNFKYYSGLDEYISINESIIP